MDQRPGTEAGLLLDMRGTEAVSIGGVTPEELAQVLPEQARDEPPSDELLELRCSSY